MIYIHNYVYMCVAILQCMYNLTSIDPFYMYVHMHMCIRTLILIMVIGFGFHPQLKIPILIFEILYLGNENRCLHSIQLYSNLTLAHVSLTKT